MTITLTKAQYRAVNDLRGLPEGAHMMVMCSRPTDKGGGILEGDEADFDELVSFIGESLADGMLSETKARPLRSLCVKIDPDCADWLGM